MYDLVTCIERLLFMINVGKWWENIHTYMDPDDPARFLFR